MCVFMPISCNYKCSQRNAQDSVGLGKRPCDKISVKYVTPKISFLFERDYYRKKMIYGQEENTVRLSQG